MTWECWSRLSRIVWYSISQRATAVNNLHDRFAIYPMGLTKCTWLWIQCNLFSIDNMHQSIWQSYKFHGVSILRQFHLTVISSVGSSRSSYSPLQWLVKTPTRLYNKYWVPCFLARLSLSCNFLVVFCTGMVLWVNSTLSDFTVLHVVKLSGSFAPSRVGAVKAW